MSIGSLFSGIGGVELGLESCGLGPIAWQCDSDPHARAVLATHWPSVHRFTDIKDIDHEAPPVDIICGGFPCQDISNAGKRAGIDGERSGLWSEFARVIRVLRPRVVFVENVRAILVRGIDRVLGDLADLGFDAEWEVFRASDIGAPHSRERLFVLAYSDRARLQGPIVGEPPGSWRAQSTERHQQYVADATSPRCGDAENAEADPSDAGSHRGRSPQPERVGDVANTVCSRLGTRKQYLRARESDANRSVEALANSDSSGRSDIGWPQREQPKTRIENPPWDHAFRSHRYPPGPGAIAGWHGPQPAIRRGDDGVPGRAHRLRLLGNSCVPAQAALAWRTLSARALEARRAA